MKVMKPLNKKKAPYYIEPYIKSLLDKSVVRVLEKDWDRVFLIDGAEGSGKSLLGLQIAKYIDPTFHIGRVTFSGPEFSSAINKATKGQCVIFDEAFNGLSSSGALSHMNKLLVRKLMECRQKNLFLIIILPTFFLLQKYAAIFRSSVLFHVYVTKSGNRGYYRIYNKQNKKMLYLNGLKYYSYAKPYIYKSYRFYGNYPIDEAEYREKKHKALITEEKAEIQTRAMKQRNFLLWYFNKKLDISLTDIEKVLTEAKQPLNRSVIGRIVREYTENGQKQQASL